MITVTSGKGLITPNETQIVIRPTDKGLAPRYGALYTHGAGSLADGVTNYGNQAVMTNTLARAGVVGVSADYGGTQTWGSDAAMNAMDDAWEWLQAQPNVKPGKVILHGGSMGGLNALVWAARNPNRVAAISVEIPVIDLDGIWRANISNFRPLIDAAYGGMWKEEYAPSRDPLTMSRNGNYAGMPILVNYGDADAICLPAKAEEFLDNVPSAVGFELSGGHAESTQLQVDRNFQANWLLGFA